MEVINTILERCMKRNPALPGDYLDDEGFILCGKCSTRKQFDAPLPGGEGKTARLPIPCKCQREDKEAEERFYAEKRFKHKMEELKKDGITDKEYLRYSFSQDDRRSPKISETCMRYVESWEEMRAENMGILLYGSVGTGKSFLACCIANALLEKLVPVSVTNFPRILNRLQGFDDEKQKVIDGLQKYGLLVVDDLGVERDTPYVAEQIFNIVDTRERSGKPVVFTTNLTVELMENASDIQHKRIYDRVLKMCPIRLNMAGQSRRAREALERRDTARDILGAQRS